jgi:hypothetical protein
VIVMKDNNDDTKDSFTLKLIGGTPARQGPEFGNPTSTATYTTCVWEGSTLIAELVAPPGTNWKPLCTKGYKYLDPTLASDGLKLVKVVGGPTGTPKKTKVIVGGKGVKLPDPPLPVPTPVNITAQVIDSATSICFGQSFGDAHVKKNAANPANTLRTFKAVRTSP